MIWVRQADNIVGVIQMTRTSQQAFQKSLVFGNAAMHFAVGNYHFASHEKSPEIIGMLEILILQ
jgi:hypothetical protein